MTTCVRIISNAMYHDDLSEDHVIMPRAEVEGVNTTALQYCNDTDTEEQFAEEQPTEEHPTKGGLVSTPCFTHERSGFLRASISPIYVDLRLSRVIVANSAGATALSFAAGTHLLMYAVAWSLDAEKANQADSCRSFHLRLERS